MSVEKAQNVSMTIVNPVAKVESKTITPAASLDVYKRQGIQTDRNGNIAPIKNQSPRQRIDGAAALLDCYVGLYEHYNEFINAI